MNITRLLHCLHLVALRILELGFDLVQAARYIARGADLRHFGLARNFNHQRNIYFRQNYINLKNVSKYFTCQNIPSISQLRISPF